MSRIYKIGALLALAAYFAVLGTAHAFAAPKNWCEHTSGQGRCS